MGALYFAVVRELIDTKGFSRNNLLSRPLAEPPSEKRSQGQGKSQCKQDTNTYVLITALLQPAIVVASNPRRRKNNQAAINTIHLLITTIVYLAKFEWSKIRQTTKT